VSIVKKSSLAVVPVKVCVVPRGVVIVVIAVAIFCLQINLQNYNRLSKIY
jgi:hypothetical protein